jgi:FkbM family methyltransferase
MIAMDLLRTAAFTALARGIRAPRPEALVSFIHQGQLLDLLHRLRVNVVLDVGANEGWYSQHLRRGGFRGRIVTFEPNAENHPHIAAKADADWRQAGYALGESNEVKPFNILRDEGGSNTMSSFLQSSIGVSSTTIEVDVKRLDDVLPDLLRDVNEPRIFLKVDTQGFDLPVVRGAGAWLPKVVGLQSEISVEPIYKAMTPYTESLANYHAMGFGLVDLQVVRRKPDGMVLEYDCLMARAGELAGQ